jgi:hypothetical protein
MAILATVAVAIAIVVSYAGMNASVIGDSRSISTPLIGAHICGP